MKYIILILTALSLFSCTDLKKGKQLESIEKMNLALDSIQTVLFEHEIDTIAALGVAANTLELRIKNNYYADTIDMELGKKMDGFKVMRRTLGPLGRSYSVIKKNIVTEKETLKNLKTDIEKGNGERDKYDDYVKFEEGKVQQLRTLLKDYVTQKEKTMTNFFELYEELNTFSLELLKKNQTKPKRK